MHLLNLLLQEYFVSTKFPLTMGNLLRVLNDKGPVPKVDFFVDFESESEWVRFLNVISTMTRVYILTN